MLSKGIRPDFYCAPILKTESDRLALVSAAISADEKFFLGTDTAPHFTLAKESACGCAGVFNATYCMSIITQLFDDENSLDKLERFTSLNGAKHYELKTNQEKILINKQIEPLKFKKFLNVTTEKIMIFEPNFPVYWKVEKQ